MLEPKARSDAPPSKAAHHHRPSEHTRVYHNVNGTGLCPGMTRLPSRSISSNALPARLFVRHTRHQNCRAESQRPRAVHRWELDSKCLFAYSGDGKVTPALAHYSKDAHLDSRVLRSAGQEGNPHNIQTVLEVATEAGARILIRFIRKTPAPTRSGLRARAAHLLRSVLVPDGTMSLQLG